MSSDTHDIAELPHWQESLCDQRWDQEIVPRLPAQLEEQAWACGAMCRKSGKLTHASDLLRGILAYVLCVSSFRQLGAWGLLLGIGDLADTSWRERLCKGSRVAVLAARAAVAARTAGPFSLVAQGRLWLGGTGGCHPPEMCRTPWPGLAHPLCVFLAQPAPAASAGHQRQGSRTFAACCAASRHYLCA